MASIELDWADEDANPDLETSARRSAATFNLTMEVVAEHGPGGGWPVYRFTGRQEDIVAMLGNYAPDEEDREMLIDTIEE